MDADRTGRGDPGAFYSTEPFSLSIPSVTDNYPQQQHHDSHPTRPHRTTPPPRRLSTLPVEQGSAITRFAKDAVMALDGLKEYLPEQYRPWFWTGLWFGSAVVILGLVIGYHSRIFQILEGLAAFVKSLGSGGPFVIMTCLFIASFPPAIGYSSIVTMSGFIYGFKEGFLYAYIGALVGAVVCFYLCRQRFKARVRKLMTMNQSLKGVVRTVEKRGFKLLVLIRLAPYPYNIMNALLSATHIPLTTYTAATAISLLKLTLHVYIGSTLSSLTTPADPAEGGGGDGDTPPPTNPNEGFGKKLKIVVMVFGILLGIAVGGYVWKIASREIEIAENLRIERRRRRRQQELRQSLQWQDAAGGDDSGGIDLANARGMDGMGSGRYRDEEDGHEDQALFGSSGRMSDWRNVGANADSSTESDNSDDYDDDDDDDRYDEDGCVDNHYVGGGHRASDDLEDVETGQWTDRDVLDRDDGPPNQTSSAVPGGVLMDLSPWHDDEAELEEWNSSSVEGHGNGTRLGLGKNDTLPESPGRW